MSFEEAAVLQNVRVHQERLAAAGSHPEGDLVELRPSLGAFVQRLDTVGLVLAFVECGYLLVQGSKKSRWVAKIAVQVDLGKEQRQVLKVFPDDWGIAASNAPVI